MAYKQGKCWACQKPSPVDSHHVKPLEYGGAKDGLQVSICQRCHGIVHREGEHYSKHGTFKNFSGMIDSPAHGSQLKKLIKALIDTKIRYESGDEMSVDHGDQRLTTTVSWANNKERLMAHAVKKAMGFKSLDRAIKAIVLDRYERMRRKGRL